MESLDNNVNTILEAGESPTLARALLASDLIPVERRLMILMLLIDKIRDRNSGKWRDYVPAARKALDSRKSGLIRSDVWNQKLLFPAETYAILLPSLDVVDGAPTNPHLPRT
jgi:hypothetical protein